MKSRTLKFSDIASAPHMRMDASFHLGAQDLLARRNLSRDDIAGQEAVTALDRLSRHRAFRGHAVISVLVNLICEAELDLSDESAVERFATIVSRNFDISSGRCTLPVRYVCIPVNADAILTNACEQRVDTGATVIDLALQRIFRSNAWVRIEVRD